MRELGPGLRVYVAVMVLFLLAPLAVIVVVAFNPTQFIVFPPRGLSLRWFDKVFGAAEFMVPLWNSVVLGLVSTLCSAALAVPAALALVRYRPPGSQELQAFLLSPLSLPTIVLATGLLFFTSHIGLGNSFWALLAGHVVLTTPYILRTVFAVYSGINREIEEAASVLGAGPLSSFFLVTLPMIRPGILAGAIFAFLISFDEVPVALFLSNTDTVTLPVSILSYLVYNYDPAVAAISTVQMLIVLALLLLLEHFFGIRHLMLVSGERGGGRRA